MDTHKKHLKNQLFLNVNLLFKVKIIMHCSASVNTQGINSLGFEKHIWSLLHILYFCFVLFCLQSFKEAKPKMNIEAT